MAYFVWRGMRNLNSINPRTLGHSYFKIVHAIAHRKYYRNWMTKVGVILPWFGGMCLILFPAMGTSRIVNGQCLKLAVWPHKAMGFVSINVSVFMTNINTFFKIYCY